MAKVIARSLFICVVLILTLPSFVYSQSNSHVQFRDIIGSDAHTSFVNSAATPKVISHPDFGTFNIFEQAVSNNRYMYTYTPELTEGKSFAVVEYYRRDLESGVLIPDYTTINFRITKSLINCGDDRYTIFVNEEAIGIDVLENDTRTDGPLSLTSILYVEGGIASIDGNTVSFTPDQDFEGDAFVYYSVTDQVGKVGSGILKIKVLDPLELETEADIAVLSHGGEAVEIDLPYPDFVLEGSLTHGTYLNTNNVNEYVPFKNQNSTESFVLRRGNLRRNVTVRVVEKQKVNSWVVDDIRYTSKGSPVTLDVLKNDHRKNVMITNSSSQLYQEEASEGLFTYSPPAYFSGTRNLEYTSFNGFESETGKVVIHVGNFNPTRIDYKFNTVANSALIIDYKIPISNYSFSVIDEPRSGQVNINEGSSTINVGCDEISGRNLILYEPSYNYLGSDEFKLRYCVDGKCKNITIKVEVLPNDLSECACYTGCVWSGDANNDGVVNASDLLSMAYAFGSAGAETVWSGSQSWLGRKTDDWLFESQQGINAKHSDADGNGIIDELDFESIFANYNENHALVPPQVLDNKSYAFTIVPQSDTVYAGDLISLDIGIGSENYPALDVNGLVYNLGFAPSLVDSASLSLEYHNDSWFGIDEKVFGIAKQTRAGWVETAVSRLGVKPKSGNGTLGTINFIVEEDVVGGFRTRDDGIIPLPISIKDARVLTGDGSYYKLPDIEKVIYINLNQRESTSIKNSLSIYPNPSDDFVNIHISGEENIDRLEIFGINGQLLESQSNLNSKFTKLAVADYNRGVYVVKATTSKGVYTSKFEVL